MTNADRTAFAGALYALGETFNEPVSSVRAEAYFDALRDLPTSAVLAAAKRAVTECRFFPRPVELREMVEGTDDDAAERAWNAMRRIVRTVGSWRDPEDHWPDEATKRAALELFGGWKALCENLPAGGPEMLGLRKAFAATFKANANHLRTERVLPKGEAAALLAERMEQIKAKALEAKHAE